MQRNANMLKIIKKCIFADFIGFFAKMQSPVCPPNELFPSVESCDILCIRHLQSSRWA